MAWTAPAPWLAVPGRCAGIGRRAARAWLAVLAMAMVFVGLTVPAASSPPEFLHDAIVAALRHGGEFYYSTRDLLRTEPDADAARLLPPALAVIDAAMPGWGMLALVAAVLTILMWAGGLRFGALFARTSGVVMVVSLLAAAIAALAGLWLSTPHAAAAAALSALALVARARTHCVASCATACAAAIIDPAALITIGVMGALASAEREGRETIGWLTAGGIASVVLAVHLHALSGVAIAAPDPALSGQALARLVNAGLPGLSQMIAAPLLILSAFGWATIGEPLGPRVVALMLAGVALDGVCGMRSATLAAAFVAPGIALAPGALADLMRGALDRRRITVTRVVR